MSPRFAKDFDEEVRATVDDFRVILEIGCGVDHPEHLDDPVDPIEIAAQCILNRCDQHEADLAGMAIPLFDRHPGADLTPGHRTTGDLRTLAGQIEQVADPLGVDVVAERAAHLRQGDVELLEPLLDVHGTISKWWQRKIMESAAEVVADLSAAVL